MTETPVETTEGYALEHGWRTLALAGGAVGLVGILAIALPFVTGLSVTIGLGALLVVAGIVHGVHTFTARGWRGSLWQAALAVVSVVAGLVLLVNPLVGLATLTILLVAYLLVDGLAELWMAVRMADQPGRAAIGLSGLVSLVLAGIIWAGFPADATWALGLLVGVGIFVTGVSMVAVAYTGRKLEAGAPAGEPRRA